jgi:small subunit ribosomal protein S7
MRRRKAERRPLMADMKYGDPVLGKFLNVLMRNGKKALAERIAYRALNIIGDKMRRNPLEVFRQAIENVKPELEVKPRRVGGATYQVPYEVRPERQLSLAFRWIVRSAIQKKGKPMYEKLANELMDAYNNTGMAIKKKEDTHKMAEANKAFSHYRI